MADVVMPRLSDSMEEGTILQWLKKVGDEVAVGDELVEIETDKANMAYESDVAGTLTEIVAQEGETVPIGAPIARVGDPVEGQSARPRVLSRRGWPSGEIPWREHRSTPPAEDAKAEAGDGGRPKASPIARRLAQEKGLDLSQAEGSGPGGRIVKADVEKAEADAIGAAGFEPATPPGPPARLAPETAKGQISYRGADQDFRRRSRGGWRSRRPRRRTSTSRRRST